MNDMWFSFFLGAVAGGISFAGVSVFYPLIVTPQSMHVMSVPLPVILPSSESCDGFDDKGSFHGILTSDGKTCVLISRTQNGYTPEINVRP